MTIDELDKAVELADRLTDLRGIQRAKLEEGFQLELSPMIDAGFALRLSKAGQAMRIPYDVSAAIMKHVDAFLDDEVRDTLCKLAQIGVDAK